MRVLAFFIFMGINHKGRPKCSPNRNQKDQLKRFNDLYKVNPVNGCWEWQGALRKTCGAGNFMYNKKQILAYRASYMIFKGEIPNGLMVCHKCDNRQCVNPEHLYVGTAQNNIDDMYERGQRQRAKCPSVSMYNKGCRCDGCVKALKEYNHQKHIKTYDPVKERERKMKSYYAKKLLKKSA